MGPSILFLNWLADLPTTQVGAVPRFAVLRWALGEDADFWLPSGASSVVANPVLGVATAHDVSRMDRDMERSARACFLPYSNR